MPSKLYKFPRNEEDVLVCDHGEPLHEECMMCEMDKQYRMTNRAVVLAVIYVVILMVLVVWMGLL